jgi:hypothetical protein
MQKDRARATRWAALGALLAWLWAAPGFAADTCPPEGCFGDQNGDGMVAVNEVILAVNNLLNGCPTPNEPLGTRVFTIAPVSEAQRTALYSSALPISVASVVTEGPLTIEGGTPDENGIAPLTVTEDAMFAVRILDGSVVCFRVLAEGSSGTIDCDGGTAYDVVLTAEPGPDGEQTLMTGQGNPAGAGHAALNVMLQSAQLPSMTPIENCATAEYDPPSATVFTTTMATTTKGDRGPLSLEGEAFNCASFGTTDGDGMLVSPSAASDARAGGDVVNNLRLADRN